jgi:hypothetical protein
MIPFLIVKTRAGLSYIRPDRVLAVNSADPGECVILLTDGVTIAAAEPAEDVVARLEARAGEEEDQVKETRNHGHGPR